MRSLGGFRAGLSRSKQLGIRHATATAQTSFLRDGNLIPDANKRKTTRMAEVRRSHDLPPEDADTQMNVPGDSFGLFKQRTPFYRPVPRLGSFTGELARWMPPGQMPELCISPDTLYYFQGRYGCSLEKAYETLIVNNCDPNCAARDLQEEGFIATPAPYGPFGVVALESYFPETFCFAHILMPSFEATRDPEVLDVVHELVMSAAEIPVDCPRNAVVDKFVNDWTIEDGTPVKQLLDEYKLTVKDVMLLPFGEYACQGFYVAHPVHKDFPNIGSAAAAVCLDLKSGIHNRFRFEAERIADTLSEHMVKEYIHFETPTHFFRQPLWFEPESSIEDYIRMKEYVMSPSLTVFEVRTAQMKHGSSSRGYRNIIEADKLRMEQHKMGADHQETPTPSKNFDSTHGFPTSFTAGTAPGTGMSFNANEGVKQEQVLEDRVGHERDTFEAMGVTSPQSRKWRPFYENHIY